MKLAFGYLFLMTAFATAAAAVPARLPHNPIAVDPSGPEQPEQPSVPVSPPSSSDSSPPVTSPAGHSDPTSTDVQTSTTASEQTSTADVATSSTDTPATSSTDISTSGSISTTDQPTATSSDVTPSTPAQSSITSSDVPPTTDPKPSTSSITSAPSKPTSPSGPQVDKKTYLDEHNQWRQFFGAADLQWSDDLAAKAQSYAEQCQLKHSDGANGPVGENLAAATGNFDAKDAVKLFVSDYRDFSAKDLNLNHFTQVVWSATTKLGCGVATCGSIFPGRGDATYHVCLYDPVGNVVGEALNNLPHFA